MRGPSASGQAASIGAIWDGGSAAGLGSSALLDRFAGSRDEAAFAALVAHHGPMVRATCRRILVDGADADDAFQATFLVLARRAGTIHDGDRLAPWLHSVARRAAVRVRSRTKRRREVEEAGAGSGVVGLDDGPITDDLTHAELRAVLDEELDRLPAKYREPLVLCYLEGLTHDEAARQLAWPVGTVRSRLAGGRDRLRARLSRRGFAPGALSSVLFAPTLPLSAVSIHLQATTVRLVFAAASRAAAPAVAVLVARGVQTSMILANFKTLAAIVALGTTTVATTGIAARATLSGDGPSQQPAPAAAPAASAPSATPAASAPSAAPAPTPPVDPARPGTDEASALKSQLAAANERIKALEAEVRRLRADQAQVSAYITYPPTPPGSQPLLLTLPGPATPTDAQLLLPTLPPQVARNIRTTQIPTAPIVQAPVPPTPPATPTQPAAPDGVAIAAPPAPPTPPAPPSNPGTGMGLGGGPATGGGGRSGIGDMVGGMDGPGGGVGGVGRRDPSEPYSVTVLGTKVMRIDPKRLRVTIFDSKSGAKETFHPTGEVTAISPIWSANVVALELKGPKITQTAAACRDADRWFVLDLREPVTGKINPVVASTGLVFRGGRYLYAFSGQTQRWDVAEMRPNADGNYPSPVVSNDCVIVTEGDTVHIFNFETGLWKSTSLGDDQ